MKDQDSFWECSCGERISMKLPKGAKGEKLCPNCGAILDDKPQRKKGPRRHDSTGDTQMLDLSEMAKMAQEGVDVQVSGEWVTPLAKKKKKSSEGKDS